MPESCVLGYCSNKRSANIHLYHWSKDAGIARKWTAFVALTRSDFTLTKWSMLCSDHFTDNDYTNLSAYRFGFQKKLYLKPTAVPSILPKRRRDDSQCKYIYTPFVFFSTSLDVNKQYHVPLDQCHSQRD